MSTDFEEIGNQLINDDQRLLALKLLAKCKSKEEKRKAFSSCQHQMFALLKKSNTDSSLIVPVLTSLQVLLSTDSNAEEWAKRYGMPFVDSILKTIKQNVDIEQLESALKCLQVATLHSDSLRDHVGEANALSVVLPLLSSHASNEQTAKAVVLLLDAICQNEQICKKFCDKEYSGVNRVVTIINNSEIKDQELVEATIFLLNTLLSQPQNRKRIVKKVQTKVLWNAIVNSLKLSSKKRLSKDEYTNTRTIHEPEYVVVCEKTLTLLERISRKKERVQDVYKQEGIQILPLLFSMICFFYANTATFRNVTSSSMKSINSIIHLLKNLSVDEQIRKEIIKQFPQMDLTKDTYFYEFVEDKSVNGAQLILHQFRNRNINGAQTVRTQNRENNLVAKTASLLGQLAKFSPEEVFKLIDYSEGISNCIFYLRNSQVESETKIAVADLLTNILTPAKNRAKLDEDVTREIVESVFVVLQLTKIDSLSKVQWRALQILRYVDITEVSWMNQCLEIMQKSIPSHRLCDWLLQSDYNDTLQEKLFFTFLETLKNQLMLEQVSGYDFAHLGITKLIIDISASSVYKEISLYILANTTGDSEMRDHFVRNGGLFQLVPHLLDQDENVVLNVLKIIENVCEKNTKAQQTFAEIGGLQSVLQLVEKLSHQVLSNAKSTSSPSASEREVSQEKIKLQIQALASLNALIESESNARYAASVHTVESLFYFLHSYSSRLVLASIKCLKKLSHIDSSKKKIASSAKLVSLLSSENSDIQQNICTIVSNVALDESCRQIVAENGAIVRLQELVESDEEYLSLIARMALDHLKSVHSESLMRAINAVKATVLTFDEKKKLIETQYARTYQSMIGRSSIKASASSAYESLMINIDWQYFDKLSDDEKHSALHLMKKSMWDNLRQSICTFCDQSAAHSQALLFSVKTIIVKFDNTSYVHYEPSAETAQQSGRHAIPSAGTLYYNVGYDEVNSIPVRDFVQQLNELFVTAIKKMKRASVMNNMYVEKVLSTPQQDVVTMAASDPVGVLKKVAKEAIDGQLQLEKLMKLLTNSPYFQPTAEDAEIIQKVSQQILLYEEKFLKGYPVVKLNKHGLKQERYLLITDKSYYTVRYDPSKQEYDKKHSKRHVLREIFLMDLGHFDKAADRPFLCVYTKEKASKNRTFTLSRKEKQLTFGMFEEHAEMQRVRPSTNHCYANIFTPPISGTDTTKKKSKESVEKDKLFLKEISWVLFAAASNDIGLEVFEPFEDQILEKPTGIITSFIFKKFKFGL